MEIDGEGGGSEAERRGRSELGGLLLALGSEVLEKRIPLIKQLEELSADDLDLILQVLLASWVDSTCSGVSHCALHRSILQVALKCSDLDITEYHLGQFLTLAAKASSWCGRHLQWSVKFLDQSQVAQEEEHNRLRLEVNSLSFSVSTKLHDIAAKCITVLGLEVAVGEDGQGAVAEDCVLNKAADAFPTLETVAVEVERAPVHLVVGAAPWSLEPVRRPRTQKASRRCTHCASEKTSRWLRGPDGPCTLCNACGQRFDRGRLLPSNSRHRQGHPSKKRSPSKENGNDVDMLVDVPLENVHDMAMAPWSLAPLPREASRRCMHCASEKTQRWLRGPDGPATLCNACGQRFYKEQLLLRPNSGRRRGRPSKKRRSSSKENSAASDDVAALVEALPCGAGASLNAFFDHTFPLMSLEEAGPARGEEEEEELEWLSNKDAFPSVETMAVETEEAPSLDAPPARTKGRRRVTAMETSRLANVPPAEKETAVSPVLPRRRCTHCATETTPRWLRGPEGPQTLCKACGVMLSRHGRLLPEYRPANSPTFSPLLHSNIYSHALKMHRRSQTSALVEVQIELMNPPANGPISSPVRQRYPSVETMAVEVEETPSLDAPPETAPPARTKGRRRVTANAVQPRRRCTHCRTEETPQWREGPEGARTLCNACGVVFKKNGRLLPEYRPANSPAFSPLLHSNRHRRVLKMHGQNSEEEPSLDAPPARTRGRPRVTANAVQPRRRCTHCGTEETPQWREGPEGARTLCNACGVVFKKNGRLLPEYRPAKSPAFSPQLHSNRHRLALEMHSQNGEEETSVAGRATSEACRGDARHESIEVQLLQVPEREHPRPPADRPAFSQLLRSGSRRKSEVRTFAAIRATANARRAERAAARLAAVDN